MLESTNVLAVHGSGFDPGAGIFRLVFLADHRLIQDTIAFSAEAIKAGDSPTVEATKWLTGFIRDYYMFRPILDRR